MLGKLDLSRSASLIVTTALVFGLGVAVPAGAQTTGGAIVGVVTDTQGGVLPGVTLTERNADTGMVRTTVTEADGRKSRSTMCRCCLRKGTTRNEIWSAHRNRIRCSASSTACPANDRIFLS